MFKNLKSLLGDDMKKIRKPILILICDSVFSMFSYGMLYLVLVNLLNGELTALKIKQYTLMMIVVFIIRAVVNSIGFTSMFTVGAQCIENLRINIGDHLRTLNLGYFNKNSIGDITSTMTGDLSEIEMVLTHGISDLIKAVILTIYVLCFTFIIDPVLALFQIAIVAISLPIIYYAGVHVKRVGKDKKVAVRDVISRIVEYLNGIQVFKAHNLAGSRFKRLEKSFNNFRKESIRTEVAIVPYVLAYQLIVDMSFPVLLLIGVSRFISGSIDHVQLLTFIVINIALTNILRAFSTQYGAFKYMSNAVERVLKTANEPEMPYLTEVFSPKKPVVEFKNVSFSYEDTPTLNNISFTAKPGTITALIGPSGAGKTTIISLIARFFDINKGEILIDNQNIKDVHPDVLLKSIGMVFQDVYLLHDSVLNNIKLGNPNASKEDVIKVCKIANCHDFIMKMENEYETTIGEGGTTISGGEKQRISIARGILKDAPIILLDEATASLDADNEYEVRKSLNELIRNKTVIVIAHRLNTIIDADQIILLNDGEIEEVGTHFELMRKNGHYTTMINTMKSARAWKIV